MIEYKINYCKELTLEINISVIFLLRLYIIKILIRNTSKDNKILFLSLKSYIIKKTIQPLNKLS